MRISPELRNYLERAREVFASHHQEPVSTAEVCKLLLESAIADHLDDRMAVADLWIRPAEALWTIRCKCPNSRHRRFSQPNEAENLSWLC